MKLIAVDNFGRETVSDRLIAEGLSEVEAQTRAADLNAQCESKFCTEFYRAVPDAHVLYVWEP